METFEGVYTPESDRDLVFRSQLIDFARVVKADLQPNEVFVEVNDVSDEVSYCVRKLLTFRIFLRSDLKGVEEDHSPKVFLLLR